MKHLLFAPLILSLSTPVFAIETCTFTSQYEPEVTIEVNTKYVGNTKGIINYKDYPVFSFSTGIRNGYGGQWYEIKGITHATISHFGEVVTVVGEQAGKKGTPKDKQKKGQVKIFLPGFATKYFYSLTGPTGYLERKTEKMSTILRAAEGFWIPSEICKKYVPYGW